MCIIVFFKTLAIILPLNSCSCGIWFSVAICYGVFFLINICSITMKAGAGARGRLDVKRRLSMPAKVRERSSLWFSGWYASERQSSAEWHFSASVINNFMHKVFPLKGREGESLARKHISITKTIQMWFTYFLSTDIIISCKHLASGRSMQRVCLFDIAN